MIVCFIQIGLALAFVIMGYIFLLTQMFLLVTFYELRTTGDIFAPVFSKDLIPCEFSTEINLLVKGKDSNQRFCYRSANSQKCFVYV